MSYARANRYQGVTTAYNSRICSVLYREYLWYKFVHWMWTS